MAIKLFDSLTREIRELSPSHPDGVFRFYNCGLTVYASAHIGNFRTFVINDVLRRLLILEYGAGKVRYVRNLTDVDDKTIARAREEGRPLAEVTKQWTDKFHADCDKLNCLPMEDKDEPRATSYIKEQVDMIDVLMKKGNAYRAADGSVYFKVSSFDHYGELSRVKERELKPGSALKVVVADADEKEDVSDFALWKAHKDEDGSNSWDSPWGHGRPGWHIECSAMSKALLGETIDLHTGAVDLRFPHHENEIAQSQCCNGVTFARHWYHNEHLLVDGKKMSKSEGTLYTVDDIVARGVSPLVLRYALLMGHPRKQLNFTFDSLHAAESALVKLEDLSDLYDNLRQATAYEAGAIPSKRFESVFDALRDDLNMPGALGELFTIRAEIEKTMRGQPGTRISKGDLLAFEQVLFAFGFDLRKLPIPQTAAPIAIQDLAEKRRNAKFAKDFTSADSLRKEIAAAGWNMTDNKDGSYILEPMKKA